MTDRSAKVRLVAPARLRDRRPATGTRHQASPPTLNEEAYRRIEEMIVTLELKPGSVVSEAILSVRIGIGKTPIREALQRLAREHLVQILPRRGVIVTAIDVRRRRSTPSRARRACSSRHDSCSPTTRSTSITPSAT